MGGGMGLSQYLQAIDAVFEAAGFAASFQPMSGSNYCCNYNGLEVQARQNGGAVNFNSTDSQFSATDSLANPNKIQLNGDAMMAYFTGK